MKIIPPKGFYKFSKQEQELFAVEKMNEAYQVAEKWKQLAIEARRHRIIDSEEINRPDEAVLKDA